MKQQLLLVAALTAGILLPAIAQPAAAESSGSLEPAPGESAYAERAERLLAVAIETGDELGTARAQYLMAQHMRALRLHSQALVHARLAQDAARRVGDENTLLAADIAYGASLGQLARTAEAIEILLPSLEQARALENIEQQLRALLALSTAYFHAKQLDPAVDYARQGLVLARADADRTHTASFLSNLGLLAYTQGDLVAASAFVQDALALEDLPPDIQRTLTSASITLAGPAEAESRAREAIAAARDAGNTFHEGFATAQLGHILCTDGRLEEAASAFTAADRLLREADAITDLQRTYEVWAECLQQAGRFEEALAHQREARALLEQAHERRQDEIRQAHEIAFRTEQRLSELARLTADEQSLQARIARQRALTGWLAAGALLLAGVLAGVWARNRHLREQHHAEQALQQARVDLLARTSHEIRNPTQGIIGILEGVQDGDAPLERQRLDTVLLAARMVGHLANEYLDLALLEQGKLRIDAEGLCHLPDLVEQMETLSAAFTRAPGQFLVTRVDERVPDWIHTDGERLAQVLLNLISNAAHYAGDGEITLTVTAEPEAETLRYSVADRGPGFDLSDAASFDPYARGSRHSANPRGSGLGLAISARIVHAMGGTITARNRRSGGAELMLSFPLRPVSEAAVRPDRQQAFPAPASAARTTVSSGRRRVLIIDDDPFARLGLQSLVESIGGQVEELDSGREVEQCLQRFDPHIVLVDYQLGDTTGTGIAKRIRQHDAACGRHRLIVIISGTGRAAEEHQASSAADRWLLKPVGRETMLELLGIDVTSTSVAQQTD